jgi:chemotaxis protein MotB
LIDERHTMTRKKQKVQEAKSDSLVQLMTISLFIILLAFFILLNTIAKTDEKKQKAVMGSIVENFGGESPAQSQDSAMDDVFTDGVSPVDLEGLTSGDVPAMKDIAVTVTKKRTTLSIPDQMLFTGYGSQISRQALPVLNKLAGIIKTNGFPVDISAHTDDMPLERRIGITNRELTTLRSSHVMAYLIERGKVKADRLTAFGWGMEKPAAPNTTARTRELNRRIDVTFFHGKSFEKPKGFFIFKDFFFNVKDH